MKLTIKKNYNQILFKIEFNCKNEKEKEFFDNGIYEEELFIPLHEFKTALFDRKQIMLKRNITEKTNQDVFWMVFITPPLLSVLSDTAFQAVSLMSNGKYISFKCVLNLNDIEKVVYQDEEISEINLDITITTLMNKGE